MAESVGDSLEGLMMGNVSEEAKESDEQIQARIAAAQARIQQIKKDETKAKSFDGDLAKLVPKLSKDDLDLVIFLINHEIPSLTILGVLSVVNDEAGKICFTEFERFIESRADFSKANLPAKVEDKLSYWWTFIYGADHVSTTTKLAQLKENEEFVKTFSQHLSRLLKAFLANNQIQDFDMENLKKILQKYQTGIFGK